VRGQKEEEGYLMLLQERHTKLLRLARGESAHSRLQRTSESVRGEGGGGTGKSSMVVSVSRGSDSPSAGGAM
jgi:hypothetical protein